MKAIYVHHISDQPFFTIPLSFVRYKFPFVREEVVFAYDQSDTIAWLRIDDFDESQVTFTVIQSFFDGES